MSKSKKNKDSEYVNVFTEWIKSLPPEEREQAKALGVDKPEIAEEGNGFGVACAGTGFSFEGKRGGTTEPDALKLAKLAEESDGIEIVTNHSPFHDLLTKEEKEARLTDPEETRIKMETVSGLLSFLFRPQNGAYPSPFDVLCRVFCLTYVARPQLLERWQTLEQIAAIFGKTKQAVSKEVLKLNNHGLKARQGKGAWAVSKYRENSLAWWKERREQEKKEKRRQYLKEYNVRKREEKKAKNREYYLKNKERLLAEQKKKRKGKKK